MSDSNVIGIIGGSGLQSLLDVNDSTVVAIETPFADEPTMVTRGVLGGVEAAFVQRHGVGHVVPPDSINARANVAALADLGCRQVLSVSAVGSLKQDIVPGTFVVVDQFVDRSRRAPRSFFGPGLVGHVPFAEPVCGRGRRSVCEAMSSEQVQFVDSGTYVVMEGPQFSTRAESEFHRRLGGSVIGMTAMPEAKLVREAQLCYTLVAIPTDYDCWYDGHDAVTAEQVSATMARISDDVQRVVHRAVQLLAKNTGRCPNGCHSSLSTAIMTDPEAADPEMVERLRFVVPDLDRVWP